MKTDLKDAGTKWGNRKVVEDGNLLTSRRPDHIPAFNARMGHVFGRAPGRSGAPPGAKK
jgi:protease I